MKQGLKQSHGEAADGETFRNTLTPDEVAHVARELNVKPEEVIEMETRMSGGDVALEPQTDDGEESYAPIAYLADDTNEPTQRIEARQRDWMSSDGISTALAVLDERSRRIVEQRWLQVNDDSSGGMTLHELAAEYSVSAERIRQIEVPGSTESNYTVDHTAASYVFDTPGRVRLFTRYGTGAEALAQDLKVLLAQG